MDESKRARLLRFRSMLGTSVRSFRSKSKMGKIKYQNFEYPILTEKYLELMENRLSSSGIFAQDLRHWRSSRRSRNICKIGTLNHKNLKIESSSCQCPMTSNGQRNEIQNNVFQIPKKSRCMLRSSRGHWTFLKKRNGMKVTNIRLKENGFPPPRKWWNDSKKQVTLSSRVPVLWVVEF